MSDFMELGNTGIVPLSDGRYLDTNTGKIVEEKKKEKDEHEIKEDEDE